MSQAQEIAGLKRNLEKCARKHAFEKQRADDAGKTLADLKTKISKWVNTVETRAGISQEPTSLPQTLLREFRAALERG